MGSLERDHAVARFLYREARLLDQRRYRDWLELWTDDAQYALPTTWISGVGELEVAGNTGLHHLRSDRMVLGLRVEKLLSQQAWAEQPPSRTVRTVSNIEVDHDGDALRVRSNVVLHRVRCTDDVEVHAATRIDHLVEADEGLRLASRRVDLAHGVLRAANLEFFL